MKFGKEFRAQMVPEWQEAFMDYDFLKALLKDIQMFKLRHNPSATSSRALKRKLTLYRAFSGLTQKNNCTSSCSDIENQSILVNSVNRDGSQSYQTTFLMLSEEGGELELSYFRRLDDEFNKVDKFYKAKVEEVMKEASMLNTQMDALIAFRIKVDKPTGWSDSSADMTRLASDVAASAARLAASSPSGARAANPISLHEGIRLAPLEILDHVKINNTHETPSSIIKVVLKLPEKTQLEFTRENLTRVEDQLKRAFVEFYQKLRLLKSYSFLNILAFSKIMKKYDKITSRGASKAYMEMVDNSYLGSSDEVIKVMDRVEATFIKHFSNSNRTKGMSILRPKAKKERHRTTFFMGYFSGCTGALIIALISIIHVRNIMNKPGRETYMKTMFPLYSLFAFVVLHMLMYAANIYFWRRYRVNYSFIFGFKQGTEMDHRQVLLVSFAIAVLALICVILNLDMEMDPETQEYKQLTELLPLNLLILLLILLILPLNILYRSARFFFLTCLFHCIAAPLYKVSLPDFFLADQITSQVQAIRSLQFYICYYGWGDYKKRENNCNTSVYNTFYFIVAGIPYWSRLLQCLRRLFEEKDPMHGVNGLKYFVTLIAVSLRTAYSLNKGASWKTIAWIFSVIAATYGTFWDIVIDWGLLQRHSKNLLLRNKLLIPYKSVYYVAMVLNALLRFAWLQTVLNFNFFSLHAETSIAIVASLEIIRRGMWNFFRLENEHLNNVGKYRAFKSVPLPFNYDEDDDGDE